MNSGVILCCLHAMPNRATVYDIHLTTGCSTSTLLLPKLSTTWAIYTRQNFPICTSLWKLTACSSLFCSSLSIGVCFYSLVSDCQSNRNPSETSTPSISPTPSDCQCNQSQNEPPTPPTPSTPTPSKYTVIYKPMQPQCPLECWVRVLPPWLTSFPGLTRPRKKGLASTVCACA